MHSIDILAPAISLLAARFYSVSYLPFRGFKVEFISYLFVRLSMRVGVKRGGSKMAGELATSARITREVSFILIKAHIQICRACYMKSTLGYVCFPSLQSSPGPLAVQAE